MSAAEVLVSSARDGRFQVQSFPRRRESTPQAIGNALPSDWIPAFAGMTTFTDPRYSRLGRGRRANRSAEGQRRWPLLEHATWHGHPARDVHGQDGHATTLVAALPRRPARRIDLAKMPCDGRIAR